MARWWLVGAVLATACGQDDTGSTCVPGRQEACACPAGGLGTQVCAASGSRYAACQCPAEAPDAAGGADAPADPADAVSASAAPAVDAAAGDAVPPAQDVAPPDGVTRSEPCKPCGMGDVKGIICAPNEQVFVPNAKVVIDTFGCDGAPVHLETTSSSDGTWYLPEVPCGLHEVNVSAGAFQNAYNILVETGKTTDITGVGKKQCFKAKGPAIAVFWGQWDELQHLVDDLGFEHTYYQFEWDYFNDTNPADIEAVKVLRDPALLGQYDIVFFNCGSAAQSYVHMFPEIAENLEQFVLDGGSMYASDLAWAWVEGAFPDAIDFYGTNDLPSGPSKDGPQQAQGQQIVPATIIDAALASYVGVTTFPAKYGPGPLVAIAGPGPGAAVHVSGLVKVEDTSFQGWHFEAGPLVVTWSPPYPGAGRVVYTTFHNDEQADALMLKVLHYLVFQL